MSDSYPEYLNPFAEDVKPRSKLTIRNSFRELKRNLRQSFRIKKKKNDEEVTLRQKNETLRRLPVSYSSPPSVQEALPRSRFQERLAASRLTHVEGTNPFEGAEDVADRRASIARRKKRAPLPPNKSLSSQDISGDRLTIGTSNWSLTSADTDYSGADFVCRNEETDSILKNLVDFNKNMEKLADDSNNNVITKEERRSSQIPDIVISCENSDESENSVEDQLPKSVKEKLDDIIIEDNEKGEVPEDNDGTTCTRSPVTPLEIEIKREVEDFLFNERKIIYRTRSEDDVNNSFTYTEQASLYVTEYRDDVDNNNVADSNGVVPVPKMRKNKLNRNALLGNDVE